MNRPTIVISPLSLPFELLRQIFETVGWSNNYYNARERSNDLCSFGLVHSSFLYPSLSLLYRDISIRNSGRANILARTLRSRMDLAELASSITYKSDSDLGIPTDLVEILSLTNHVTSIDLGARLFSNGLGSIILKNALKEMKSVRSFASGTSRWSITKSIDSEAGALNLILDLLSTWKELKELAIRNCATSANDLPSLSFSFPTYQLTRLEFVNVDLWITEFAFLFGDTTRCTLKHLTLRRITILKATNLTISDMESEKIQEEELLNVLGESLSALESLTLFDIKSPFNINDILSRITRLHTLNLGSDLLLAKESIPLLHFPSTLVNLRIEGSILFDKLELFRIIDPPISLKSLVLVGVLKSSPSASEFMKQIIGNSFEVIFQSIYS